LQRARTQGRSAVDQIELAADDVHRFVSQRVANRADAADIAQETLLIAWTELRILRGEQIRGCLFAIAGNLIDDYNRARTQADLLAIDPVADDRKAFARQASADAVVAKCDFRRRLHGWLRRCNQLLDPGEQVAVLLTDVYEYRNRDSAALLNMSVPSFKLLLHRSRARLKEFDAAAGTAPVAVRRKAAGVVCRLNATDLRSLRRTLVAGICRAMTTFVLICDSIDFELLDVLFDL
jgi:RNA polymerase sigma factor (sigma-70 family)